MAGDELKCSYNIPTFRNVSVTVLNLIGELDTASLCSVQVEQLTEEVREMQVKEENLQEKVQEMEDEREMQERNAE